MTDIAVRLRRLADEWQKATGENGAGVSGLLRSAADEIGGLRFLLKECADELADQVEGHYAQTKDHPAMKRRYDRDMQSVLAARAALNIQHREGET